MESVYECGWVGPYRSYTQLRDTMLIGGALTEFFGFVRTVILLGGFQEAVANESRMHRRAQRAESSLARSRRETEGQRKRAEWWRSEAKRLGWGTQLESIVPQLRDQLLARVSTVDTHVDVGITVEAWVVKPIEEAKVTVTMTGDPAPLRGWIDSFTPVDEDERRWAQVCCQRCIVESTERPAMFMVLCPTCGNKRCPKANDHRNECTGSNVPGQKGSAYP